MNSPIIQAVNIHKQFGNLEILKGISLEVFPGEIVAIIGASGAGKTTLLQILGTLDNPTQGEVYIRGEKVSHLSENQQATFRNKHIGFVFQSHQLLPEFSALENVALPALIAGVSWSEAFGKARSILTQLGLQERLQHHPAQLSGGEKQRVAVARALVNNPLIIFADEPSGALDSGNKEELHNIIQSLRKQEQRTFIIVTHDDALSAIADRVLRLQDGQLLP